MRRKITSRNYGKYPEVFFITSNDSYEFSEATSITLSVMHGVHNVVLRCDDFESFNKETKKQLRKAYCIIFVLSSEAIRTIEETFNSDGVDEDNLPSFIKIYKYINKINNRAIACVIPKNWTVDNNLIIPDFMGDFEQLHRLELTFCNITDDAETLLYNIRYFHTEKQKEALETLKPYMGNKRRTRDYYLFAGDKAGYGLFATTGLVLVLFLFLFLFKGDFNADWYWYYIIGIFVFPFVIAQERMITYKKQTIYEKDGILRNVLFGLVEYSLYLAALFGFIGNNLYYLLYFITLIYLLWDAGFFWSVMRENDKLYHLLLDDNINFLDFTIELRKFQAKELKKRGVLIALGIVVSIIVVILLQYI